METGFYEVETQNRLVRGTFAPKPTRGTQGRWHPEKLFFLARDEIEAQQLAYKQIRARRMIGISKGRAKGKKIRRQIKIINIRRLV